MGDKQETRTGISFRAIVIGLALVVAICFIVSYAELVVMSIQIGFLQMPPAVIGLFFFIVLVNRAAQNMRKRLGLTAGELMMIYCMMLVASMVSSRGIMEKLLPLLVVPNYFANPANRWQELFYPHIRRWLVPFDPEGANQQLVSERFFERLRAGETIPWEMWVTPLTMWGILVLLVVFAFLCLASILRRQWVDNEKLAFPLAQPPLELVRVATGQSPLRNGLLWAGIAIPALVFFINGLHNIYPNIPAIGLSKLLNEYLVNPPWNMLYYTPMYLSFAAVGFFFMLSSDLLFALWFFAIFIRLQMVLAAAYGFESPGMPLYSATIAVGYQVVGAYFVLAGYLIYVALPHLKMVVRSAMGRQKVDDSQELMPYRIAVWGLLLSFALIMGWCCLAGMSLWVAVLQFGVFLFVIALIMARSTAEGGLLMTETSFRPVDLYRMFAPVHSLGATNLTMLAFLDGAFMRDQRGLLLTGFLDGLKITDGANTSRRAFLPIFGIALVASLIIAGALQIWMPYDRGGLSLYPYVYQGNPSWVFTDYQSHMTSAAARNWQAPVFFAVGVVFTIFLSVMRALFYWWPLHPLGFALSASWTMTVFWFSCLVAWMIKIVVLRYGGMKLYVRIRPFFLGMVLGEFGAAVIWTLISVVTGVPAPEFPWP